jgi:glutathione synthase/RimK-type ligase-like ATP-grasp enzyme
MIKLLDEYKKLSATTLGINDRNLNYIDKNSIKLSNSKIRIIKILNKNNIPTPKTITLIKNLTTKN